MTASSYSILTVVSKSGQQFTKSGMDREAAPDVSVPAYRMVSEDVQQDVLDYFHFWPSRDLAIVALSLFLFASLCVLAVTIR